MPRPRRPARERISLPCTEYLWLRLIGEITDESESELTPEGRLGDQYADERFEFFLYGFEGLPEEVFERALAVFVEAHPGRRPEWWWNQTLRPGPPSWWSRLHAPEPRRQVSGRMIRRFHPPVEHRPTDPDWAAWRNSLPSEGRWEEVPDPDDPRMYESSAAYLRRLNLFLPGEEGRLRPADFEPECSGDPLSTE